MPTAPTERRLAAIMFTDIVGYTALMAESEAKGLRARERHRALVRPLVEKYHGESIEARGDESLSVFPTALDAVNCALAIEDELHSGTDLKLHIGIHLGDVVVRDGEVSGDGVNIASRICALSQDGGLCVSGEVYQSVRNQPDMEAVSLGEHELKNVGRPVAVYALGRPGTVSVTTPLTRMAAPMRYSIGAALVVALAAVGWWGWTRTTATPGPIRSIAVLPLENLSGDSGQDHITAGMHEALITSLARIGPELLVTSRTSVMQYEGTRKTIPEIAGELGVDGVIEGSALREGDRVRIAVQLIDARRDTHLWAQSYERSFESALALQREIARDVAVQTQLALSPEREQLLADTRPVDPEALDAYLLGRRLASTPLFSPTWMADHQASLVQFERAVKLDSDFAEGWAALAGARVVAGAVTLNLRSRGELPKAREAAQRALELDDRLAGAHATLGWVRLSYDWDFPGARRAFERALELSPSDPSAPHGSAMYLLLVEGRFDEALGVSERLLRVAPLDLFWRSGRFGLFFYAGQYERALEEVERLRELWPDFMTGGVAETYYLLGRDEEAYRAFLTVFEGCGAPCEPQREAIERGWAEAGWEGALRAFLDVVTGIEGHSRREIAMFYTYLGETDEAFAWLERGYRERDPGMVLLKADARMDPLRTDPRFDDLLRRIGFPES